MPSRWDDDARWGEAESVLAGLPTSAAGRRLGRRRTRVWLTVASLTVAAAIGVVVAVVAGPAPAPREVSAGREVAEFVPQVLGLAIEIAGIVLMVRRGVLGGVWRVPTAVLTWRQRRRLVRQVLGREPVEVRRLGLAWDLAVRLVDQRYLLVLHAGLVVMWAGRAVGDPSPSMLAWAGFAVVSYVVVFVALERQSRRAQRFLRDHPVG